jgi:surface antigen
MIMLAVLSWTKVRFRRLVPLLLVFGLITTSTVAVTQAVTSTPASAGTNTYPSKWSSIAMDTVFDDWGEYNRECTSYVAWMLHSVNGFTMPFHADASQWVTKAQGLNYTVNTTAAAGAVGWMSIGHVAYIESVNTDGTVNAQDYNYSYDGTYQEHLNQPANTYQDYIHFDDLPSGGGGGVTHSSTIIKVKKVIASDGTQQVYYATSSDVYEAWWNSTSGGVRRDDPFTSGQNNIVDFDKITQPNGTQSLYTAVPDGIWETFWNSTSNGPQNAKIITGLSGVEKIIASSETDGGIYTHVLYVLKSDGAYEYWWQDGSGLGIQSRQIVGVNNPVAFTFDQTSSGVDQVFTASAGGVWESWWTPGSSVTGSITTSLMIALSQNNIKSLNAIIASNGTNELYTGTTVGVWQSYWTTNGGTVTNTYPVTNFAGSVGVEKKFDSGGSDQLYASNGTNVQQYWWNSSGSGGATLINIPQGNIASFDLDTHNGLPYLYTGAGAYIWETYWDGSGIHTSASPIANANQ